MILRGDGCFMALNRRQFLKSTVCGFFSTIIFPRTGSVFGGKVKSAQGVPTTPSDDGKARNESKKAALKFFDTHQRDLVLAIGGLIVALDSNQKEVAETMVSDIDEWVAGSESKKKNYTHGLKWIDTFSDKEYGSDQGFLGLKKSQKLELLDRVSSSLRQRSRRVHSFWGRVHRKLDRYWDSMFGIGSHSKFFNEIREDAIASYYSNPDSWLEVGYYGPPQPAGYPHFDEPPEFENHTDNVRTVNSSNCLNCHETGHHSRGGIIDLSCTYCHHPHSPWPYEKDQTRLEDELGIIFPSPDKKQKRNE